MSTVPPITCEISEPGHAERGHCVPVMRNALALLVKEKASFAQEFVGISRSAGEIFLGVGMGRPGQERKRPHPQRYPSSDRKTFQPHKITTELL